MTHERVLSALTPCPRLQSGGPMAYDVSVQYTQTALRHPLDHQH